MDIPQTFFNCKTAYSVHVELRALLCCDYLNEEICKQHFTRLKLRCRTHFTSPVEQSLSNTTDILDKLEEKGLFGVDNYGVLKDLIKGTDESLIDLITKAEKRIAFIRRTDSENGSVKEEFDSSKETSSDKTFKENEIEKLSERLKNMNKYETDMLPLSPLQEEYKLPVEQLFSSLIMREDLKYNSRLRGPMINGESHENKEIKSPKDIFTVNDDEPARRIYIQGDAAIGKTTYCLWVLKQWCDAKENCTASQSDWVKALSEFDFAFFLPMRSVHPSRVFVKEMICKDLLPEEPHLHKVVEHVLLNDKYRCLVILDGMDEWNQDESTFYHLRCKALPNFDNISNCVYLISMRKWWFPAVSTFLRNNDKVIEIKGLEEEAITQVIEKVLVHHFGFIQDTGDYRRNYDSIMEKLTNKTLRSFIQIPLLAVACAQIWCRNEEEGDSLTKLYAAIIEILLEREYKKHPLRYTHISREECQERIPKILAENENIAGCFSVLLKMGEAAFYNLVSKKPSVKYNGVVLKRYLSETEYKFALDVGFVSQVASNSVAKKKTTVNFFYSSIQEFLAANFIIVKTDSANSFCSEHLTNMTKIMACSNLIMFIFGMRPSLGIEILKHVDLLTTNSWEISEYRKTSECSSSVVAELYRIKMCWYREFRQAQADHHSTFPVSDVYLSKYSDMETVRLSREILLHQNEHILSLYLSMVPTDKEYGITNEEMDLIVSKRDNSLVKLYINGFNTDRTITRICGPYLTNLYLYMVRVQELAVPKEVICNPTVLERVELFGVTLKNRSLGLNYSMKRLMTVKLWSVHMSAEEWEKFWLSLRRDSFKAVSYELKSTNIDDQSLRKILSDSRCTVRLYAMDEIRGCHIHFITGGSPLPLCSGDYSDGGRDVRDDGGRDVCDDGGRDVRDDGGRDVRDDGGRDVCDDGGRDVCDDGGRDVRDDGGRDVRDDGGRDVCDYGGRDVCDDGGRDVRDDGGRDVRDDGGRDVCDYGSRDVCDDGGRDVCDNGVWNQKHIGVCKKGNGDVVKRILRVILVVLDVVRSIWW